MEPWRPDWLDESAYDFLTTASWEKRAWEFLRRNDKYQADWDKVHADCLRHGVDSFITPLSRQLAKKWCLTEMVVPSADKADGRWLLSRFAKRLTKAHTTPNSEYLNIKNRRLQGYGFDLTKPIDPQVKAVMQDLLDLQKALVKEGYIKITPSGKRTGDLRLYLRILDARAAKVSKADIVNSLEPYMSLDIDNSGAGMDRLTENLKAARKIAEAGYKDFLLRLPEESL